MTRNCESCAKVLCTDECTELYCENFAWWTPSLEAYEKLERDFEKVKKALKFYADIETWSMTASLGNKREFARLSPYGDGLKDIEDFVHKSAMEELIYQIGGKLARQTLLDIGKNNGN